MAKMFDPPAKIVVSVLQEELDGLFRSGFVYARKHVDGLRRGWKVVLESQDPWSSSGLVRLVGHVGEGIVTLWPSCIGLWHSWRGAECIDGFGEKATRWRR